MQARAQQEATGHELEEMQLSLSAVKQERDELRLLLSSNSSACHTQTASPGQSIFPRSRMIMLFMYEPADQLDKLMRACPKSFYVPALLQEMHRYSAALCAPANLISPISHPPHILIAAMY